MTDHIVALIKRSGRRPVGLRRRRGGAPRVAVNIRTGVGLATALALCLIGPLGGPAQVQAQSMSTYTSSPMISAVGGSTPNVIVLLDNSGSMDTIAYAESKELSDSTWDPTVERFGFFDSMMCYVYDATDNRFEDKTARGSLSDACPASRWDGNFLNFITFRRIDAAKIALIGGECVGARDANGLCQPIGAPATPTLSGQTSYPTAKRGHRKPFSFTNADLTGRIPNTKIPAGGVDLVLHVRGGNTGMQGSFCTDNDNNIPPDNGTNATACAQDWDDENGNDDGLVDPPEVTADGDAYSEEHFFIRTMVNPAPTGVIQEIGSSARLGVMTYQDKLQPNTDGGIVLVPIGSRQFRSFYQWCDKFTAPCVETGTVTTHADNTAAMVAAIDDYSSGGNNAHAEALYEAMRYVAQIDSAYFPVPGPGNYTYPLAFSGVSLGSIGVGSIGVGEETVLTGAETCPAGYITDACGRDPFFFGSNHTPAWASPSVVADCCKTYIVFITDGASHTDDNIPAALQDYAHGVHGTHCTQAGPPACSTLETTPPATLLLEHKIDHNNGTHYSDDVAYWGHTTDLRQATIPVIGESGHDIPGVQNVTVFPFYAFGTIAGRELLMQTARQGGFEDSNGNNVPDLISEYDAVNNYTGAAGPDGLPDTYFESRNAKDMKDRLSTAFQTIVKHSRTRSGVSVMANSSSGDGALYQSFYYPSTDEGPVWVGYTQGLFVDTFGNLREDKAPADGKLIYKEDYIIETRVDSGTNEVVADRFIDADGNGVKDLAAPSSTVPLKDLSGIWEAGKRLAQTASSARTLLTWIDKDNDGVVDAGEQIKFDNGDGGTDNTTDLTPYVNPGAAPFTATNIINFIRGQAVVGMRDRTMPDGVWKLGDSVNAPPVVVGAPAQRFDLIYGDDSYTDFFYAYRNRRQVAYVAANDGMLHAFNAGYYHYGDDPGTGSTTEHGCFNDTLITGCSSSPPTTLGNELWGFIPQELLPHLKWLTQPSYGHVYYVDLTPKAVDARIFCDGGVGSVPPSPCVTGQSSSHPNGWGTILMGGFRLGGSCGNCPAGNGSSMTVTADFNDDGDTTDPDDTRSFYSAYFVLDVTNPEQAPKLLWSFSDANLGFTTTVPALVRVNPAGSPKTDHTKAKWFMVMGSGPTGYDGSVAQSGNLYAIDLIVGPEAGITKDNDKLETVAAETLNAFMGDPRTVDRNFNYRVDVAYTGSVIDDSAPPWRGKLYRLTMNSCGVPCSADDWGIDANSDGTREATEVLDTFGVGPLKLGPVSAAPGVAIDDSNKLWVFAGTGRHFNSADEANTDQQYVVGVKDSVMRDPACTQSSATNCHDNNLVNMSTAKVCVVGVGPCGTVGNEQVTNVTGLADQTFDGLIAHVQAYDGWYTTLPDPGERVLSSPTVFGGIVFFTSFVPGVAGGGGGDPCAPGSGDAGESFLYALYYKTGSAYSSPIVGVTPGAGKDYVNTRTSVGDGMASGTVVHIGDGSGLGKARVITKSGGVLTTTGVNTADGAITSRMLSWGEHGE